ncbi:MAG: right-handed parallel beta-helix repeat-containing protein [Calditrichaeota bacterium]|nr:right-handed parallel beta-helix repeat-containing protein [Calditrichota bacterium]
MTINSEVTMKRTLLPLLGLLFVTGLVHANTHHVPGNFATIQAAIDAAAPGDTVLVADGNYTENINFRGKGIVVGSHYLTTGDSLHIFNTVIDGSQPANPDSGSVVSFVSGEDTTSVLSGFTITGGSGTVIQPPFMHSVERGGAGVYCFRAAPKLTRNIILNNNLNNTELALGAGVLCYTDRPGDRMVIEHNTIRLNRANSDSTTLGGGLALIVNAVVRGNDIVENTAFSQQVAVGGAIFSATPDLSSEKLEIRGNRITHNKSTSQGAAYAVLHMEHARIAIQDNEISQNTVSSPTRIFGGGLACIFSESGSVVSGNRITANQCFPGEGYGGGVVVLFTSALNLQNNLLRNNSATYGGGLACYYASPVVQGNVLAANQAESGGGAWLRWFPFEENPGVENPVLESLPGRRMRNAVIKSLEKEIQVGPVQLVNNTVADNRASREGGGLSVALGSSEIVNGILWGNTAPADSQIAGLAVVNWSDVQGGASGEGNISADPRFDGSGQYYLSDPGSPCIDAGHPNPAYNDVEDPGNPGSPLWPALGTLRNDMGAYGGEIGTIPNLPTLFGPMFRAFATRVEGAPINDRSAVVDSFMAANPVAPFVEEQTFAYFLYRGSANSVNVPGDANGWNGSAFPMTRLSTTNLWYYQAVLEPDARLDYKLVINGSNWILDPLNPRQVQGGFGPNSELAMPGYVDPPEILFNPNIAHGTRRDTTVASGILGNSRTVSVYLPPQYYSAAADSFPIMLFHDGGEFINLASAINVLDNLIAQRRIDPVVGIFVPPVNRDAEYALGQRFGYEQFIVNELMPALDARLRIRRSPDQRAMLGISYGGLITTQICYNRAEAFGLSAPMSPSYWANDGAVYNSVINGPVKDISWYLDWGTYEPGIMIDAQAFQENLANMGYGVTWNEWHEGHSWGNWRAHIDLALETFFPGPALNIVEKPVIARDFELMPNFPNPFNPTTTIRYNLPVGERVVIKIYNILGQEVRTLINGRQPAGERRTVWDGLNNAGQPVGSGIYILAIRAGHFSARQKMILLK